MDDFVQRVEQIQYNSGISGTNMSTGMYTNANSYGTVNSSIWTQAQELENRYKVQIQTAAKNDPMSTTAVMNDFLNEALDLLFSSLNTNQSTTVSSSSSVTIPTPQNKVVDQKGIIEVSDDKQTESQKKAVGETDKTGKKDDSKTTKETKTTTTSSTGDTTKTGETSSKTKKLNTARAREAALTHDDAVIKQMVDSRDLSFDDKVELFSAYLDEVVKNASNPGYRQKEISEKYFIEYIANNLASGDLSAKDAIKAINKINEINKNSSKDSVTGHANYTSEFNQTFVINLYKQAQKEGVLVDAYNAMTQVSGILSPTKPLQEDVMGENETLGLIDMFEGFDQNITDKFGNDAQKQGISKEREALIRKDVSEFIEASNKSGSSYNGRKVSSLFSYLYEKNPNKYNDNERVYFIKMFAAGAKNINARSNPSKYENMSDMEYFVRESFRGQSWWNEEKYLKLLLASYAKNSARLK